VHLNGTALPPNADISPVFPPRYHVAEGTPADYRAYNVPASLLKDEKNTFEIIQTTGDPVQLFFMDVSLP